uniref:CMP/dCMP-type deaminase domain-containing protein n=1 Tax=Haemonchus contortus TaxID=6289 RepID=A0A7I4YCP3_HAECO|nr:CMP dCMP deaminase domain containing protein [Haemonchus contortus]
MVDHMRAAVSEACAGVQAGDGGPFGAVVVKEGKIVASGHNMVLAAKDPTAHAEMTAIRNACKALNTHNLSGCVLYTSCYPCPMCLGACLWARFDSIYYGATTEQAANVGFDDKVFHEFLKNPRSDQHRKLEHLPIAESSRPFELWAKKMDKQPY